MTNPVVTEEHAVTDWIASAVAEPKYDLALARMCAEACARAYREQTFGNDLAHVLVVPAGDGKGQMANGTGATIIAFRGSANTRDWLTDFEIRFRYTQFGRVHAGFWESTNSLMASIMALPEVMGAFPVIVTGHSKGAAEAVICARLLAAAGKPVAAVVTFGGPRVGDAAWRIGYGKCQMADGKTLGEITQRWVHEEDIVCRMAAWCTGYRHVGTEAFMSSFGGVELNPPFWRKAASDLWGTFWGYAQGHIDQVEDHPVSRYLEHLDSL